MRGNGPTADEIEAMALQAADGDAALAVKILAGELAAERQGGFHRNVDQSSMPPKPRKPSITVACEEAPHAPA